MEATETIVLMCLASIIITLVPAAMITALAGGKALFLTCAATGLAAVGYVIYFFLFVPPSTGMEGIILVFIAVILSGLYIGAILGWGATRLLKLS